ncbi:enoyl-CoA hydratase/isomerase family protein [Paracoccus sp. FO-3]|uniref:enoyl-CoA hydratase/isomerase family protein n=1 Tax=Paracoccus sp. FO-3 TaxID=1335059 RepID=UPI00112A23F0|nr:enoyl-CoA hydratase/isomerase family protein [Paracoccus sp. FO-3]
MQAYSHYTAFRADMPHEGVLRLTLCHPERLNSLDKIGHQEIADVWRQIHRDAEVRSVLLCAEGRAFSAGGDFSLVEELSEDFRARVRVWHEARELVHNILDCEKPIVSAIQGPAVGAGLVAALLADISVASKTAKIVDGHTRLGVAAGDHAAIIWPILCGIAKAKYYLLLCEPMTGEEAERIGLVSMVTEPDELQERALEIACRLAKGAPTAIRWTKHSLNNWMRSAGPMMDASLALEMLGFSGPEVKEGLAALRERREPVFGKPASE